MKTYKILSMTLRYFKGAKNLVINFGDVTKISGDNGTGKTTVADAFKWNQFDKDSTDRKDFNIKTLDANNEPLHGLEHEVVVKAEVDGKINEYSKIYKEKWTKQRSSNERTFTGHTTEYMINSVPKTAGEFKKAISDFCDENIYKMLTDPLYFSDKLNWKDRRNILIEVAGDVSNDDVIATDVKLKDLAEQLGQYTIDEIRKMTAASRKKLNEKIKAIPVRIDEANRSIAIKDFAALKKQREEKQTSLKSVEDELLGISKQSDSFTEKNNSLKNMLSKLATMEREAEQKANQKKTELENQFEDTKNSVISLARQITNKNDAIAERKTDIISLEEQMQTLRNDWGNEDAKTLEFDENEFVCKTCNRPFETDDIDSKKVELTANFNKAKSRELERIEKSGVAKKQKVEELKAEIADLEAEREKLQAQKESAEREGAVLEQEISEFEPEVIYPEEYSALKKEAEELEAELSNPVDTETLNTLREKKKSIQDEIDQINKELAAEEENKKLQERIEELKKEEREYSSQLVENEKLDFLAETFIKAKVALIENKINSMFSMVNFKLFNTQINGGIEETCEALINGVPFSDANNGSKINAGLDIINTLSKHYGIYAPIFIDNAEAVTKLIPVISQLVLLNVVEECKELKVVAEEKENSLFNQKEVA